MTRRRSKQPKAVAAALKAAAVGREPGAAASLIERPHPLLGRRLQQQDRRLWVCWFWLDPPTGPVLKIESLGAGISLFYYLVKVE